MLTLLRSAHGCPTGKRSPLLLFALPVLLTAGIALAGGPPPEVLSKANPRVKQVMAVQEDATPSLMALENVLGTAVGLNDAGQLAVVVYVNQDGRAVADTVRAMRKAIEGIPVRVELTEPFEAMKGPPGGGGGGKHSGGSSGTTVSHTAIQTPPIELGTSGGWANDLANGYCCGGTLGSLVQVGGTQYILSNYHVFESDIVPGGNGMTAQTGSYIIQPGLIDVGCTVGNAQDVATLETISSLPGSNVDAAVAQVIPGRVKDDGAILEIGTISSQTVGASLNQAVKKSGRTTGLSRSKVSGLNATVSVVYDDECAGGTAFTKTFTGQIIIANRGSKFLAAGDSGSLMVEDVSTNPRAVGLLFAGSSTAAVANPINEVLNFLGSKLGGTATMVGN